MNKKMKLLGIIAGVKLVAAAILLLLIVSGCNLNTPLDHGPVDLYQEPEEDINTEEIEETLQDLDISDLEDLEFELNELNW